MQLELQSQAQIQEKAQICCCTNSFRVTQQAEKQTEHRSPTDTIRKSSPAQAGLTQRLTSSLEEELILLKTPLQVSIANLVLTD